VPDAGKPKPIAGSIATLRILGIPVRLHFTFVLLLIFLVFLGLGDQQSGASLALYTLGLFASILLHEIGHTLMARRYGIATVEIVMFPIGGISRPERPPKPHEELWIALAGPIVNLLIGAGLLAWTSAQHGSPPLAHWRDPAQTNLAERIAFGNLILCLVNLIPAIPMDGGRVLRSLLARRHPEEQATRLAARAGQLLAIGFALAGLLWTNYFLVFVALFVYLGATQEGSIVRRLILTTGFPVRAAMITDFRTLQHSDTVREAGNLLLSTSQTDFPVMHGDAVTGLLTRRLLVRAMLREGPEAYVASAMDREFIRFSPETPLKEALPQVSAPGACALVLDAENRLLGMVTSENVSEFLLLRQAKVLQPE
jgi:Zn-dependent protease/CBS domain-containing protein